MSRFRLNRRTVLKGILGGVAASIALPPLEAMLNGNGTAYADGTTLPTLFGTGYFGNGSDGVQGNNINRWVPTTTGSGFKISPQLQPFADLNLQKYLSVYSNSNVNFGSNAHFAQEDAAFKAGETSSLDQIIAARWKAEANAPPINSINLSVVRHGNGAGNILGSNGISWGGIYDPQVLFANVFGMQTVNPTTHLAANALLQSKVLDIINDDATRLRKRLGTVDQHRLDAFAQNISDLQKRVTTPQAVCAVPSAGSVPKYIPPMNEVEAINENGYALYDILALALGCGLSRVFTIQWSTAQNDAIMKEATGTTFPAGLPYGLHGIEHTYSPPSDSWTWLTTGTPQAAAEGPTQARRDAVHQAVLLAMRHFAYFASKLDAIPVGQNSLLYQSALWVMSDFGDAINHYGTDVPNFLIGNAGGAFKGNYHYRPTNTDNHARMGLTILHALGFNDASWGVNTTPAQGWNVGNGYTNNPIPDLLT